MNASSRSALALQIVGVALFCVSFFSITLHAPLSFGDVRKQSFNNEHCGILSSVEEQSKKIFSRTVILLVDALRSDFAFGVDEVSGRPLMPFTRNLSASRVALPFVATAQTPTVTMPRIKAMTTGRIPRFIDVLHNFKSSRLGEENVITHAHNAGLRVVLYGDDTWERLFPDDLYRSDAVTSFFTKDTIIVDKNVTRHLPEDLDPAYEHENSADWDVLLLHLLGVDHVGHQHGPKSPRMREKLTEMDEVVRTVHESIVAQDRARAKLSPGTCSPPTLLILCSDHGMTQSGNHGGSSESETGAVLMFVSKGFDEGADEKGPRREHGVDEVLQIDLVPTISLSLGIPIPQASLGKSISQVFEHYRPCAEGTGKPPRMRHAIRQNAACLNAVQLRGQLEASDLADATLSDLFETTMEADRQWRKQPEDDDDENAAFAAAHEFTMEFISAAQLTMISSGINTYDSPTMAAGLACQVFALLLWVIDLWHIADSGSSCGCTRLRRPQAILSGLCALQIVMLSSTSSIENEHAVAFFCAATFSCSQVWRILLSCHSSQRERTQGILPWIGLLVLLRLLRCRNQVINFARMNELDELGDSGSIISTDDMLGGFGWTACLAVITVGGLFEIHFAAKHRRFFHFPLVALHVMCTGFSWWHANVLRNELDLEEDGSQSFESVTIARCAFVCQLALAVVGAFLLRRTGVWEVAVLHLFVLIHGESDAAVVALMAAHSYLLRLVRDELPPQCWPLLLDLLGLCAFFGFGNSHSITTVDMSGSHIGLRQQDKVLAGFLTFVITMSGPIYFGLLMQRVVGGSSRSRGAPDAIVGTWQAYRSARMLFFCCCTAVFRHHLFVWSVFAPKLLYEIVGLATVQVMILLYQFGSPPVNRQPAGT